MSVLEGARDTTVQGGNFYGAGTAFHAQQMLFGAKSGADDPMSILLNHAAITASHESAHDAYTPRCSPGTRKEIIADILTWAGDADNTPPIAWLSGPAGGGKTAIQRDVTNALQQTNGHSLDGPGRLAASYFFSGQLSSQSGSKAAGAPSTSKLNTIEPFIATVAYQMALSIPGLRQYIEKAIKRDPLVFRKGVAVQAQKVLMEPLQKWRSGGWWNPSQRVFRFNPVGAKAPKTISIDGFDEIKDKQQRGQLLHTIRTLACFKPFPLRFIIASRPELDLTTIFTSQAFTPVVHRIRLERYESNHDIERFLRTEFARIRSTHLAKESLQNWPSQDNINALIWKSSGQFIYAATIIKFVDNPRLSPLTLLRYAIHVPERAVERGLSSNHGHLAELYNLHSLILAGTESHPPTLRRIFEVLEYYNWGPSERRIASAYDKILCYPAGTTGMTLCDLHSLIHVPSMQDVQGRSVDLTMIHFFHRSFRDYLHNPSAAGDLVISRMSAYTTFTRVSFEFLSKWVANGCLTTATRSPLVSIKQPTDLLFICSLEGLKSLPQDILSFDMWNLALLEFLCGQGKTSEWVMSSRTISDRSRLVCKFLCRVHPNSRLYRSLVAVLDAESKMKRIWSQMTLEYIQKMTPEQRRNSLHFNQFKMLGNVATSEDGH